jgi:dephospho-CoA kinase
MFVLGLTGSIGMGKSTTAAMFARRGIPVHDSDAAVHRLYAGTAVSAIAEAFPDAVASGAVDRAMLSENVIGRPEALKRLEAIIHPLVLRSQAEFLARCRSVGSTLAVLDIPLLFETGAAGRVDAIIVATADPAAQRARVLARPGMSEQKFESLLARQMPDSDKRRRAHFIVDTGRGHAAAERQVAAIVRALAGSR